jgi:hypothetical protein
MDLRDMTTDEVGSYSICGCPCGDVHVCPAGSDNVARTLALGWYTIDEEKVRMYEEEEVEEEGQDCERCNMLIRPSDVATEVRRSGYDTETWCARCVNWNTNTCDVCDVPTNSDYGQTLYRGNGNDEWCCDSCLSDISTIECHRCSQVTDADDPCCDTEENGCSCEDCIDRTGVIHGYSYVPDPLVFKGGREVTRTNRFGETFDANLYMGIELEVEMQSGQGVRTAATRIQSVLGDHVYLKTDGSLDNGLEIVSHPATLDWWIKEFPWKGIREIRKSLVETRGTCGLHIHVSRNGFASGAHEHRWLLFWYRNQRIMEKLAHRAGNTYAPFRPEDRRNFKVNATKGQNGSSHYAAINTENEMTYEVRVFAGTLYVNRLKAALGLVTATVEYTRTLKASKIMADGGMRWSEFMIWLRAHRSEYPCLVEEITARVVADDVQPQVIDMVWQYPNPVARWDYRAEPFTYRNFKAPIQEKV